MTKSELKELINEMVKEEIKEYNYYNESVSLTGEYDNYLGNPLTNIKINNIPIAIDTNAALSTEELLSKVQKEAAIIKKAYKNIISHFCKWVTRNGELYSETKIKSKINLYDIQYSASHYVQDRSPINKDAILTSFTLSFESKGIDRIFDAADIECVIYENKIIKKYCSEL